jgi:phosphoribosyl-ATP pyrophosphohydrolase
VSGAPQLESLESYLVNAGFSDVCVKLKEESREVIKQWLPGSGAEDYVVSAEITAKK